MIAKIGEVHTQCIANRNGKNQVARCASNRDKTPKGCLPTHIHMKDQKHQFYCETDQISAKFIASQPGEEWTKPMTVTCAFSFGLLKNAGARYNDAQFRTLLCWSF